MESVFTRDEKYELAGQARTIHERLEGPPNERKKEPSVDADEILNKWQELYPDEDAFRGRFEQDDINEESVREQVTATHWPESEPVPEWIDEIENLVRYVADRSSEELSQVPESTAFADVFAVIAEYAREQLPEIVPENSISAMTDQLIARLGNVCVRPLYVEFKSFVEYHDPDLAAADPDEFEDPPTEYYERFIDNIFENGLKDLYIEYPVLGRQTVGIITNWVSAVTEVCCRVEADRPALHREFDAGGELSKLVPLSDDAHARGRVPIRVIFESSEVIYKPRDVSGGDVVYTVLERLSDYLSIPAFNKPKYILRNQYGWMEPVEYDDLPDEEAATRYYERAGMLMCVAYTLNLSDCQYENLITAGDQPTILDGETVFHPHIDPNSRPSPTEISAFVHQSVLLTLLPPWSVGEPDESVDDGFAGSIAGLGNRSEKVEIDSRTYRVIDGINTDVMSVVEERSKSDLSRNTPSSGGDDHPPQEHLGAITRGFSETYEAIQSLHQEDRFFGNILSAELLDGVENRLVYRATRRYGTILEETAARKPLQDGVWLSIEFEKLTAPFFNGLIESDDYWPLYAAERRALRRRDIPRFASRPKKKTLYHDQKPLDVTVETSGYECCQQRVDAMCSADRQQQIWLIQYAFGTNAVGSDVLSRSTAPEATKPTVTAGGEPASRELEERAVKLFDEVITSSIEPGEDTSWISIAPTKTGLKLVPTDPSLYHGRGGIALTAAALYRVTGKDRYRRVTADVIEPLVERVNDDEFTAGLGGMLGIGSVVYTLSVIAELTDDETYRSAASKASTALTATHLEYDDSFDVIEGAAGTLLGLLAYHDRFGEERVLEQAIRCGDQLLESRVDVNGYEVWKTDGKSPPITGFSHGMSGIAYALTRLASKTGDSQYTTAAKEGLDFESTLYDPSRNNWAKSHHDRSYDDKWCHGRTGMALARLKIGDMRTNSELQSVANEALTETVAAGPAINDNVCCGNFGRAEALLVGSRCGTIDRSAAIAMASWGLEHRDRNGLLSLPGHSNTFKNPTFFHGLSGVAYTLLRLKYPDLLPSVLLLE
ncbi:type 2 lanthipeptide synthetase LanM family protein [Natrinema sp. J7-1]|uniref:type 2 lanthipeptide synthetase LanM family protein n=1 Tax=Natrinema sp. J7-1 TaxID=1172566 RepID=UPI00067780F3|nr:type 2 lanthipeptide synthetase LanM family protein [Natrinema sp. J7-1]